MGKLIPLKGSRARKLGETVFTDAGLRLAPKNNAPREYWFGAALAMTAIGTFLTVFLW